MCPRLRSTCVHSGQGGVCAGGTWWVTKCVAAQHQLGSGGVDYHCWHDMCQLLPCLCVILALCDYYFQATPRLYETIVPQPGLRPNPWVLLVCRCTAVHEWEMYVDICSTCFVIVDMLLTLCRQISSMRVWIFLSLPASVVAAGAVVWAACCV